MKIREYFNPATAARYDIINGEYVLRRMKPFKSEPNAAQRRLARAIDLLQDCRDLLARDYPKGGTTHQMIKAVDRYLNTVHNYPPKKSS